MGKVKSLLSMFAPAFGDINPSRFDEAFDNADIDLYTQLLNAPQGQFPAAVKRVEDPTVAFHTSPSDFNKFDWDKIGSGEGTQYESRGMFFGSGQTVPYYFDQFSPRLTSALKHDRILESTGKNRAFHASGEGEPDLEMQALSELLSYAAPGKVIGKPPEEAMGELKKTAAAFRDVYRGENSDEQFAGKLADIFGRFAQGDIPTNDFDLSGLSLPKRYLTQLHLEPEKLIKWNSPLFEQPKDIQQELTDIFAEYGRGEGGYMSPSRLYNDVLNSVEDQDPAIVAEELTKQFSDAGAQGVQYKSPELPGSAYPNYVVYDPDRVEIIKKFGLAAPAGGAAAAYGASGSEAEAAVPLEYPQAEKTNREDMAPELSNDKTLDFQQSLLDEWEKASPSKDRETYDRRKNLLWWSSFSPLGISEATFNTLGALDKGNTGEAAAEAGLGVLSAIPGVGGAAAKGIKGAKGLLSKLFR